MNNREIGNSISIIIREECLKEGYHVLKMILFGSRTRNDNRADSDWDFVVVMDKPIEWKQKMQLWLPINRRLAGINFDADVVFKSKAEYEKDITDTGKISYYANKEGVSI